MLELHPRHEEGLKQELTSTQRKPTLNTLNEILQIIFDWMSSVI